MSHKLLAFSTVCFLVIHFAETSTAQIPYGALRDHVFEAVDQGLIRVPEPRFNWDKAVMEYWLPCERYVEDDPYVEPVAHLLTVAAIRKYRMDNEVQRRFWGNVLPRIEAEIDAMVAAINSGRLNQQDLAIQLSAGSDRIAVMYERALSGLAVSQGKQGAMVEPAPCELHEVVIITSEPASVKYMSAGDFAVYYCFNRRTPPPDHPKWKTAFGGNPVTLGEITQFQIEWARGGVTNASIEAPRGSLFGPLGRPGALVLGKNGFDWKKGT